MNRTSFLFCSAVVGVSLLVAALAFPFASLSAQALTASKTPTFAEEVADVDLGEFGMVAVSDLIAYYIENPPEPEVTGAGAPKRAQHFGGC
ncbi:MAG: hypothetical protein COB59_01465 [Rhodospirillaceae bacterium]|nr:MAG: hypothetical protein COB59_01465 [Rhodospirillaceae bacterium]